MADLVNVTDASFDAEVLKSDLIVVTDFWAKWSAPCKRVVPYLEAIAEEYKGQVKIAKLDIEANPNTTSAYGVMRLPTIIIFKNGQPVNEVSGTVLKSKIENAFRPYLPQQGY